MSNPALLSIAHYIYISVVCEESILIEFEACMRETRDIVTCVDSAPIPEGGKRLKKMPFFRKFRESPGNVLRKSSESP